ncbi:MAG: DUF3667 domain-containing protein [Chitinophagaceae bacterium]|nr:DUF3667 domain-containing protein [Rubrivivax sp.]
MAEDCLNCAQPWSPPRPRFCPACGQETNIRPPRIGEFMQQFAGAYFASEGALWRTLKLLLLRPGELTRQYLAGRRKYYVLPLRLYLTISLVTLLATRVVAGLSLEEPGAIQVDLKKGQYIVLEFGPDLRAGMKDGLFFCTGLPTWLCQRLQRRMDLDARAMQREIAEFGKRFLGNIGIGMFVMLPVFALLLKMVYWNRRLHYTEHLVFALHVHAFWFVALLVVLPDQPVIDALAFAAIPVYTFMAMRRVYLGRWWPRLLRGGFIALCYLMVLLLVLMVVGVWTALF